MASENKLFRTVLCPVDFSEHSRQALRHAALLVSRNGGRLIDRLTALRHSNGATLARIYGPRSNKRRGGTVTFNLYDRVRRNVSELSILT